MNSTTTPRVKKRVPTGNDYWLFMAGTMISAPRVKACPNLSPMEKSEWVRLDNIRYRKRTYKCQYDDCIFP